MWYWISLPYATGGIKTCIFEYEGKGYERIEETAPIFNWMKGRLINTAREWVSKKGGIFEALP